MFVWFFVMSSTCATHLWFQDISKTSFGFMLSFSHILWRKCDTGYARHKEMKEPEVYPLVVTDSTEVESYCEWLY